MSDNSIPGFGTEPSEVETVLNALVGERAPGEDSSAWYMHLSARQVLLDAAVKAIADQRALVAAEIYQQLGDDRSYTKVANILGASRPRVQQLIERARTLT